MRGSGRTFHSPTTKMMPIRSATRNQHGRAVVLAVGAVWVLIVILYLTLGLRASGNTNNSNNRYNEDTSSNKAQNRVYDVVLDAGSTGSRVHVFEFERVRDRLVLRSEYFKRVTPGLSSFALNPDEVVHSLRPLLDAAAERVPTSAQGSTSITLKATAGLRLLSETQQYAILRVVDTLLTASAFTNRGATLISGGEEGIYAWLTVNYLLDRLFDASTPTVATLDMGGASTQIAFETSAEAGQWLPFHYATTLRIAKRVITLYHYSYLGFGLNEARDTLRTQLNETTSVQCHAAPLRTMTESTTTTTSSSRSRSNFFDGCATTAASILFPTMPCGFPSCGVRGIPQPAIPASGGREVYVFSYFYDRLHAHITPQTQGGDQKGITLSTVRDIGKKLCATTQDAAVELKKGVDGTSCMDVAYLYSYLSNGLGLGPDARLQVREQIDGHSVSWSLGASLAWLLKVQM